MDFIGVQEAALDTFAIAVTITPAGGQAVAGRGIFRAAHQELDVNTGAVVLIDQPLLDVKLSEMPAGDIAKGALITAAGKNYKVTEVRKDGEGMASCRLFAEP